jgi:hypothetical protein
MRVIIAGSRSFRFHPEATNILLQAISNSNFRPTFVISGGAYGIDRLAIAWAKQHKIDWVEVKADWARYGSLAAGPVRNRKMAEEYSPDALICVWDGVSSGSIDMLTVMRDTYNKPYYLHTVRHPYHQ